MNFPLSRDQMLAVEYGIDNRRSYTPITVPSPVLRSQLPDWLIGLKVDFMEQYGNRPSLSFQTKGEFRPKQEDRIWDYDQKAGYYSSISADGYTGEFYYHGPLIWDADYKEYGGIPQFADGTMDWNNPIMNPKPCWRTSKSSGFGGWKVPIKMRDGREGFLWGPWHGSPPEGWVEGGSLNKGGNQSGGLTISNDLFIKALAYFQPHLGAAYVQVGSLTSVEPTYYHGSPPKGWPK